MRKKSFHAGIEMLERRETPSASASGIHALATHIVNLRGSGTGQVTGFSVKTDGSVFLTATATGTDRTFGAFHTDSASATISSNGSLTGQAVIDDGRGDTADVSLTGSILAHRTATKIHGRALAFITGRTGLVTGGTGVATVIGTLDLSTGAFKFAYSGKARI
jgi:hypothetical protein